jgi:predicted lipoprotein with Yx(FWY)xxD motif
MTNFKMVAAAFVVLTVVFGGITGYLLAYPPSKAAATITVPTTYTEMAGGTGYTVNIAYKQGIGFYLTNGTGFTLYFLSRDVPNSGTSACTTDTCEMNWPVFYVATLKLPPGLSASSFSTITAYNGTKITTYDGYPLYYWISDSAPGMTTGQGIGGFYVLTLPTGVTITTASSTTATTTTTTAATSTASSSTSTTTTTTTTATTTYTTTTTTTSYYYY